MSTKWVVTAAAERIVLDGHGHGEAAFTVTNPGEAADRVMFDVLPGESADRSWFTVNDPQRLVRGGASVTYLLAVAVPPGTAPGTYTLQGLVYAVDSAPEESSVVSPRVAFEVPDAAAPPQRWPRWWVWVAGGVAATLVVTCALAVWLGSGGGRADPEPVPTPAPGDLVMPELIGMSEREALQALAVLDIAVRPIRYLHDPERGDTVVQQSRDAGEVLDADVVLDLVVAVALRPPRITAPDGVPVVAFGEEPPTLEWDRRGSPALRWTVLLYPEECVLEFHDEIVAWVVTCDFTETPVLVTVDEPTHLPDLHLRPQATPVGDVFHNGWVRWQVAAVDTFGNRGPASDAGFFRVGTH
jgi:hypothetical protein